eukprot:COSAG02_NODE_736_length_17865_cov_9.190420_11_plen_293_part_00
MLLASSGREPSSPWTRELASLVSDLFRNGGVQFFRLVGSVTLNVAHTLLGREWARRDGILAAGVGRWWATSQPPILRETLNRIALIVAVQTARFVVLDNVDMWLREQFAFTQRTYRQDALVDLYFATGVPNVAGAAATFTLSTTIKSHAMTTTKICFQTLGSISRLLVWLRSGDVQPKLIAYVLGFDVVMLVAGWALTRFAARILRNGKDAEELLHAQIGHIAENSESVVLQNDEMAARSAFGLAFRRVHAAAAGTWFTSVTFAEALKSAYNPLVSHGVSTHQLHLRSSDLD